MARCSRFEHVHGDYLFELAVIVERARLSLRHERYRRPCPQMPILATSSATVVAVLIRARLPVPPIIAIGACVICVVLIGATVYFGEFRRNRR